MIEFTSDVLYYHKMNFTLSQLQINKQQIRQSFFTLLLFCATLFFHSEHYVEIAPDIITSFELHDCHLCQQGIDTPPNTTRLSPAPSSIAKISKPRITGVLFTAPAHIYPPLRAPPKFSHHLI